MSLNYLDFAVDEVNYLMSAYQSGMRYNAMVAQAQRICECYLKHLLYCNLCNNNEVMMSHNLRALYDYIASVGINIEESRADIMLLNNFYMHTRYPGRDAFLATPADVDLAVSALTRALPIIASKFTGGTFRAN